MKKPFVAANHPIFVELKKGEKYYWCACGLSANQPFCDGSHKNSGFKPIEFIAEKDGNHNLCLCKKTMRPPHCDGSHTW